MADAAHALSSCQHSSLLLKSAKLFFLLWIVIDDKRLAKDNQRSMDVSCPRTKSKLPFDFSERTCFKWNRHLRWGW